MKGCVPGLALKKRHKTTWKWPINNRLARRLRALKGEGEGETGARNTRKRKSLLLNFYLSLWVHRTQVISE